MSDHIKVIWTRSFNNLLTLFFGSVWVWVRFLLLRLCSVLGIKHEHSNKRNKMNKKLDMWRNSIHFERNEYTYVCANIPKMITIQTHERHLLCPIRVFPIFTICVLAVPFEPLPLILFSSGFFLSLKSLTRILPCALTQTPEWNVIICATFYAPE